MRSVGFFIAEGMGREGRPRGVGLTHESGKKKHGEILVFLSFFLGV